MLFYRASILSYRSWVLSCFPFISLCIVRVSFVSCICNSLGSYETFHCLYGKNQSCSRSGFHFVKEIVLRNRSYVNIALNSRRRRMSGKIKTVIVQYLLLHLSVEAIRSKPKHFQLYDQQPKSVHMYYFIKQWRSCKGLRRTIKQQFLIVIANCTTCNSQRCETWPRASISDTMGPFFKTAYDQV